jgi:hypothetical protein
VQINIQLNCIFTKLAYIMLNSMAFIHELSIASLNSFPLLRCDCLFLKPVE